MTRQNSDSVDFSTLLVLILGRRGYPYYRRVDGSTYSFVTYGHDVGIFNVNLSKRRHFPADRMADSRDVACFDLWSVVACGIAASDPR